MAVTDKNGQNTDIDTTAEALADSTVSGHAGILIKALLTNTATIFVGPSGVATTTGFELSPGESLQYDPNVPAADIFVIASANDQKACWKVVV